MTVITRTESGAYSLSSESSFSARTSLDSEISSNIDSFCSSPESPPVFKTVASRTMAVSSLSQVEPVPFGVPGSLPFRVVLSTDGGNSLISPWCDTQLFWPEGLLSCVCKSPAGTWLRYEVAFNEPMHPLRLTKTTSAFKSSMERKLEMGYVLKRAKSRRWQRLRYHMLQSFRPAHFVDNTPWNIGMLPQTWGNTGKLGCASRNSPDGTLGIIDIGHAKSRKTGDVYPVKPLGLFSVTDANGESSFEIVAIDIEDPLVELVNDIDDVKGLLPGIVELIGEWLQSHLGSVSGVSSSFKVDGPFSLSKAVEKIRDHHKAWQVSKTDLELQPALPFSAGTEITLPLLETSWNEFTAKDKKTIFAPAPVSNLQTDMLLDDSWFVSEESNEYGECTDDLLVDIIEPTNCAFGGPILECDEEVLDLPLSPERKPEPAPLKAEKPEKLAMVAFQAKEASIQAREASIQAREAKFKQPVSSMTNKKSSSLALENLKKSSFMSFWFQGRSRKFTTGR